ncbi:tyrosine-type recombinase/integrase [Steroidobacter flavus]|uniref:Tyrosine-type recombinase/integrase n=1 Tax=Steroidobacter flavus TaxID=1842136 RepID=A0ABV8SKQ0_9GAMM
MLTEATVRSAKPAPKAYKRFDEKGMFLFVTPTGSRLWRLKYRIHGKEKLLALGSYPEVSLKRAREKRDDARSLIADGIDPAAKKRAEREATADTLAVIADEYIELRREHMSARTLSKARWILDDWLLKYLGSRPIATIKAADILSVCRRLESRGKLETAHRTRALAGRVLRYAVATGRLERDPTADLRGALAPVTVRHHSAITDPQQIGELLRAIDEYQGQPATAAALRLAPLVFVRPGELRAAEWSEFDLDKAEWRIPGARMKMGEPHIVPLSTQAVEVLRKLQAITGDGKFLFPSLRSAARCISDNTINAALRRLGYSKEQMVGHGFRSMASTCLNEQGWHPDLIELQLAHAERNKVRAAYNRAERLAERRKMMQGWSDYLEGLKASGQVVDINTGKRCA